MSNKRNPKTESNEPMVYHIRLEGHLSPQWAEWFDGLTITLTENGDTLLAGPVVDQAALFGLLRKVRDLGLPLWLLIMGVNVEAWEKRALTLEAARI